MATASLSVIQFPFRLRDFSVVFVVKLKGKVFGKTLSVKKIRETLFFCTFKGKMS
jgi:hypothetical protein